MTPREIRFGMDGLTGIVIVSVAAALASLTWRLAGASGSDSSVAAAMDAYVPPAPPPDISAMIDLPPFGRTVVAGAASADMGLVLQGVLLANPAPASSALIAAAAGQASESYRIGDPLPNGAILERIGIDYVILRQANQFFTLYFPDDPRTGNAAAGSAQAPNGGQGMPFANQPQSGGEVGQTLFPTPAPLPEPGPQQPAARAPAVQPQAPPNPGAPQNSSSGNGLIDSLGATVTPQGYRVGPAISPQLRQAGLLPGDVVASVNGVSAASLASDPRRLTQMMASGQARVEVLRGDRRMTLSVPSR